MDLDQSPSQHQLVRVKLPNDQIIQVQARATGAREVEVGIGDILSFDGFVKSIEGIAASVAKALETVRPDKAKAEFGLDFGVEEGSVTGLFVKGKGTAALTVTLEWERGATTPTPST